MVGQADTSQNLTFDLMDSKSSSINIRDLILLTLGLVDTEITLTEAYTYTKNLAIRIKTHLKYKLPTFGVFEKLIHKFVKQGIIDKSYSLYTRKYVIYLTEQGEGEYDFKLYSILSDNLSHVFEEFKTLVSYSK